MLQIPGVCINDKESTVACHSNQLMHGKGTGMKAHDCFIAFGCYSCHRELDQGPAPRDEKDFWFERGMERTWLWLWEQGKIQVCDVPPR